MTAVLDRVIDAMFKFRLLLFPCVMVTMVGVLLTLIAPEPTIRAPTREETLDRLRLREVKALESIARSLVKCSPP